MGKFSTSVVLAASIGMMAGPLAAESIEKPEAKESGMTDRLPEIGSTIADEEIFSENGDPFRTSLLKGRYTVLVFGCLT